MLGQNPTVPVLGLASPPFCGRCLPLAAPPGVHLSPGTLPPSLSVSSPSLDEQGDAGKESFFPRREATPTADVAVRPPARAWPSEVVRRSPHLLTQGPLLLFRAQSTTAQTGATLHSMSPSSHVRGDVHAGDSNQCAHRAQRQGHWESSPSFPTVRKDGFPNLGNLEFCEVV